MSWRCLENALRMGDGCVHRNLLSKVHVYTSVQLLCQWITLYKHSRLLNLLNRKSKSDYINNFFFFGGGYTPTIQTISPPTTTTTHTYAHKYTHILYFPTTYTWETTAHFMEAVWIFMRRGNSRGVVGSRCIITEGFNVCFRVPCTRPWWMMWLPTSKRRFLMRVWMNRSCRNLNRSLSTWFL